MALLEKQQVKESLKAVDQAYQSKSKVADLLGRAASEIQRVKAIANLDVVIVYFDNHNVYRCRYFRKNSQTEDIYLVDLHFREGDPLSKIVYVTTKDRKVLAEERKEREERMKSDPPPPVGK